MADAADDFNAVAIVGMALRVPGARKLEQFWSNLMQGVESTTFFTDEQLRAAGVPEAALSDPNYVKAFGVLEGADNFDAAFFDMPPREAEILDPQHRQMLECGWEALEAAGYAPGSAGFKGAGRIGIMAGVGLNSYLLQNIIGRTDLIESLGPWQITLGNDKDFAASRVAYKLDLHGAALNISTACSTSLVATAMGCQSLLSYQCDMILAGGCSIHVPQDQGYWFHSGGTLSPDGRCRAFDEKAQGTLDGNGVAMIVLKRLEDAIKDGDTIHAVIRGFAVNNDGAVKVGYTAPGVDGQSSVIREAQEMADIPADTIGYVETHGTGTDLGDLVEITALTEAFRQGGVTASQQCAIGSVKTNVGHLDTAAGVASLIKTTLGLSHKQIPPSLHFRKPNPKLNLETSPFYVNNVLRDWPQLNGAPRRAGVSSFGIGGTNAHVVVEEAPAVQAGDTGRPWHTLPLSARSEAALGQNAQRLAAHLREHADVSLPDVAYTLQTGRRAFAHRQAVVAGAASEVPAAFDAPRADYVFAGSAPERPLSAVFMFPGQDAQYAGMAKDLYQNEPLFRREVDRCAESVHRQYGIDLIQRMFSESATNDPAFASDPLPLMVTEYALARVWQALGVQPRAMIGYSLGEYACACLAGVLSLDDALMLAVEGQKLLSVLAPGPMLGVSLPESELRALLVPGVDIAMVSAPRQCVAGGTTEGVAALTQKLTAAGASFVPIPLGYPFHTALMEPFLARYREVLKKVRFNAPKIPYVTAVTGDWITAEQATDPEHYLRVGGAAVLLAQGFETLFSVSDAVYLECGPSQVMSSFIYLQKGRPANLLVATSLRDPRYANARTPTRAPDQHALMSAIAKLWSAGIDIDWTTLYKDERRLRVPLPTYAFESVRYWVDPPAVRHISTVEPQDQGKLADPEKWFYLPTWRALPPLGSATVSGRWLVVGSASGIAPTLAERLRAAGGDAVLHAMESGAPDCTTSAGWDVLFEATEKNGKPFDHIIYLGLLECRSEEDAALLDAGFYSLLALGQSLGRRVFSETIAISVIADGILPAGEAPVSAAKAAVLGPLRVLPQEYPNLQCRIVDLAMPEAAWQRARLLDALVAELAGKERAVVLRTSGRWVESFEPHPLPPADCNGRIQPKEGGVYLITGGLGNIGLTLAKRIAERAKGAQLVLTSRQPKRALSAERLRGVQELEALGAKAKVAETDVTDEQAMAALITEVERDYGPLTGVIHAAGVVGQASFATVGESTRSFCETQLAPKLGGARVLEKVLGERELDFCMLCSSLSPILGGLGFAAYAAANACLDAFAVEHNRRHPTRWISVNWEGWRFEEDDAPGQAGAAVAELGLRPDEGVDTFERILAAPATDRIVQSTGNLKQRLKQWVEMDVAPPKKEQAARHARPAMLGAYVAPEGPTAIEVARLWESLLGIDGIGAEDRFFDLGGNSLLLTQLLAQIRKSFRLELSLTLLFERPTIADIAKLIEASLAAQLAQTEMEGEREEGLL